MATNDTRLLQLAHFATMTRWSAHGSAFGNVKSRFPLVPLSAILRRIKEPISIEDGVLYKRITVRNNGRGVVQRDELYGREIGTKRQFVAHAGHFIISRIDARNGAFGIVPKELEGAVVTNDFWLFEVKNALPEYLMLVLSSKRFQQYWQNQSSGTTNRQRVSENDFLQSEIILPSIKEQKTIIAQYNNKMRLADVANKDVAEHFLALNKHISDVLRISYNSSKVSRLLVHISFQWLSRWDPGYLTSRIIVSSKYPMVPLSKVIRNFLVDRDGKSLRRSIKDDGKRIYQYIGMEQIEKNIGKRETKIVMGTEILSQTISVPRDYVLYGKLRPYLNKYWENTTCEDNIVCSSEFFVFDTTDVERKYFLAVLSSSMIQRQLPPLYRGTRMPRIAEEDFLRLQIPLPPKDVQKAIAFHYDKTLKTIDRLQNKTKEICQRARQEFESTIFGG